MNEIYNGSRPPAMDLLARILLTGSEDGDIQLPSGRSVGVRDSEYVEWFYRSLWSNDARAAAWFGIEPVLWGKLCEAVSTVDFSPGPTRRWQVYMIAAMIAGRMVQGAAIVADAAVSRAADRLWEALELTRCQGMHITALTNISNAMPRSEQEEQPSTFVYFAGRPDGMIKIGKSDVPAQRVRGIASQAGLSIGLLARFPATADDERRAHVLFATSRDKGEWFRPSPELLRLIRIAETEPAAALRVVRLPPVAAMSLLAAG